MNALMMYR